VRRLGPLTSTAFFGLLLCSDPGLADGPTSEVRAEYLMTFVAPLDPSTDIDSSLSISSVGRGGGWAKGPRIKGTFVPPGGDWLHVLPSGAMRVDVRLTLKTDDGALIYITYNGVLKESGVSEAKANRGDVLTYKDVEYFVVAPSFETSAPRYAWLNDVQAIAKMVELKEGEGGYMKYDVFVVR
jgi:uncharacterized protein DUF3237